ncbi:TPA: recombinase family protein, partial [Enterococcus faecium]|nr:recombinase family protein [Enterococcus faecium]
MLVGYARVSSDDQNLERQLEEFKKIGVEKIFSEKKSGRNISER